MEVRQLRNYGVPFSDAEGSWPSDVKKRMKKRSMSVLFRHLGPWQRLRFLVGFAAERRRARTVDLSHIRARGVTNEAFLSQQVEYIAFFKTLARLVGTEQAVRIGEEIMEEAAREPLLLCLPEPEDVRTFDDPMQVFREYLRAMVQAAEEVRCFDADVAEDQQDAYQFDVTWCVWLELARTFDTPAACLPNCHADDLVFPEYFADLGIAYRRTQTLARGGRCCDFRFQRMTGAAAGSGEEPE